MKITILTGSPHKNGTSALLTEEFIKGAIESGHSIEQFNTAFLNIHSCIGCDACDKGRNNKKCIFKDDMFKIYDVLKDSDVVVFATPLYYHGMSSQLKAAIDRFHGIDSFLCGANKKSVLLVTGADSREWVMDGIVKTYETDMRYLQWKNAGIILAKGCHHAEDIEKTPYLNQAYQLGKSL